MANSTDQHWKSFVIATLKVGANHITLLDISIICVNNSLKEVWTII